MITLATFNLLDFFEPSHAAGAADRARFEGRCTRLASLLDNADADVLAFQEVGSIGAVQALVARLGRAKEYTTLTVGTVDARGIGNALVSRLPVRVANVHSCDALPVPVFRAGDAPPYGTRLPLRRGVVHARVEARDFGAIDLLVVHLKSMRPRPLEDAVGRPVEESSLSGQAESELRSLLLRCSEALFVRRLVDDLAQRSLDAKVAVLGDFNDVTGSLPWRIVAGRSRRSDDDTPGVLFGSHDLLAENARASVIHGGEGTLIDHVVMTRKLRRRCVDARLLTEQLHEHVPGEIPFESDHAPLVVRLS